MSSSFKVEGIRKAYGDLEVLAGIDAEFSSSSVTAILGPSGCGKTTFLHVIAGLIEADAGVRSGFDDALFSMSFQEPRLLPWLSAAGNLEFALSGLADRRLAEERAQRFLASAGLGSFGHAKPSALSGGMRRRLSLARAFAYPSNILLLDEAFAAVDLALKIELMDVFSTLWQEERRTTIFVTHEMQDALYLADRILVLSPRPARIVDSMAILQPRELRRYGSRDSVELETRLFSAILGSLSTGA
jgi:NitT/TauT family transport system ATP-binding protein